MYRKKIEIQLHGLQKVRKGRKRIQTWSALSWTALSCKVLSPSFEENIARAQSFFFGKSLRSLDTAAKHWKQWVCFFFCVLYNTFHFVNQTVSSRICCKCKYMAHSPHIWVFTTALHIAKSLYLASIEHVFSSGLFRVCMSG